MKKLAPLANYILIEPIDKEDQVTSSGLVLPEKAKEKPAKGRVIAIGIYMKNENFNLVKYQSINIGDIVVFHRWSGQDIREGEKEYKLVEFKDLMGVYE